MVAAERATTQYAIKMLVDLVAEARRNGAAADAAHLDTILGMVRSHKSPPHQPMLRHGLKGVYGEKLLRLAHECLSRWNR